ncbi:hypothetical protein Cni_G14736 [Canna indica]|uniref:Pentatricopeptide repeat-containing protein n=1 Tax=Canna indica TaxID=4628 RepID=A0AAQ3KDD7_9LILI|nr:hypothetical protein Cni_G14736 [Canna indica]
MGILSASRRHCSFLCHLRRRLSTTATPSSTRTGISASVAKSRLRREFDPDRAVSILSSVAADSTNLTSSRYALDLTVRRLARARRFSDIEALVESRKSSAPLAEPYLATLILCYGGAGMLDHALRTFDEVPSLTSAPHSPISFNALLSACIRAKKPRRVPSLFSELAEKHSITPDSTSYGILVKSLCLAGKTGKGLETLKEMVEVKHLEPTTVIYTTLLDSLYKEGKPEEAEELWKEMVEKGCVPDLTAYNVRVMHRALTGKPAEVLQLITEMEGAGIKPDKITYAFLITCHCNAGQYDDAKEVYRGLRNKGCSPNATMLRTFLTSLCENGDIDMGMEVFKDSVKLNKVPDFRTMKLLVEGLVKEGKVQEAKAVVDRVKNLFPENHVGGWKKVEEKLGLSADVEVSD